MQTQSTTITQKGQVTIPVKVRRILNLKTGDKVKFIVTSKKEVKVKPAEKYSIMHLYGSLKSKVKVPKFKNAQELIDWEKESFEKAMAEDDKRIINSYSKSK